MTNTEEVKARLEAGINELEADIAKLRAALTALDGRDSQETRAPAGTRRRRHRSRRRGARSRPDVVPTGKLSELLGASDGLSTAELASQANGSTDQVLQLLKELEKSGKAHRTGVRRSTRWHAGSRPSKAEQRLAAALDPVVAS